MEQRIVCYSLLLPSDQDRSDLLWQLDASIASLRDHNRDIPVVVFSYGAVAPELALTAERHGVLIYDQGSYDDRLSAALPHGWQILRHYPVLHKFMNFDVLGSLGVDRALFLDCDTIFARNVDILFDHYHTADVYAREEPSCRRSHYGYDAHYLDEDALAVTARAEGVVTPPPFNLGAVLFNHRRWSELHALLPLFLSYVWRFTLWMAQHPPETTAELAFGEGLGVEQLRAAWERIVTPSEANSAMPFPSSNRWISEQIAVWLALGRLDGGTYDDFSRADVAQNGEFSTEASFHTSWVLCHYFSQNTERIAAWMCAGQRRTMP